ncbi:hypothetical protein RvY_17876-1 [Ramazzottius varieornatus]|uniref:Piwi domain-containing protein n=1 Tax=Ramazzottius varieornatus TaxID=947166 RepID=A0A1D1WA89_RAMVA|nr:hypothetical protein RvY_17876-1 [Ramazzottius varieornatus]
MDLVNKLMQEGHQCGMNWSGALEPYEMPSGNDWKTQDTFMMERLGIDVVKKMRPGFIFAIFDRGADRQYSDFKSGMDNFFGIPGQGLLCDTVERSPRGCVENIMYKVNVKFGGNNNQLTENTLNSLKLLHRLFMVVGISLSHGKTKDDKAKCSYAGFVGSMDDSFLRWSTETASVVSNEALLPDISGQMERLLQTYKENVGNFPEVMAVYRDGVTHTHENELHGNDILCLRKTFTKLGITVELVLIVVNMMHRTRFFRKPNADSMGEPIYSKDNIPPGLIVDDVVVDPFGDDFYLASHRGLLGTSRPIRYHILNQRRYDQHYA